MRKGSDGLPAAAVSKVVVFLKLLRAVDDARGG
jgi:hypothetical protein